MAKARDAEEIMALGLALFPTSVDDSALGIARFRQDLSSAPRFGGFCLTVRVNKELAGFALVLPHRQGFALPEGQVIELPDRNLATIELIGIQHGHRGQGLGPDLLRRAVEHAKSRGFKAISALVNVESQWMYTHESWGTLNDQAMWIWVNSESRAAANLHRTNCPGFRPDRLAGVSGIAAAEGSGWNQMVRLLDSNFAKISWAVKPPKTDREWNVTEILARAILQGACSLDAASMATKQFMLWHMEKVREDDRRPTGLVRCLI